MSAFISWKLKHLIFNQLIPLRHRLFTLQSYRQGKIILPFAINQIHPAVADVEASGEAPPVPLAEKEFSGKFMVRIPPEQHRQLVMKASAAGFRLNRYVSAKLAG
jgi:hypothetical protein